jgi:ATP-dependent DNA helicase Rep
MYRKAGDEEQAELNNINELISSAAEYDRDNPGGSLQEYLANVSLVSDADHMKGGGGAVTLMTLHAAKGLEFRSVHIVGCEDGTLPHEGAIDEGRLDEERRLLYVGITRAKELLHLSYSVQGRRYGQTFRQKPSRFLEELPAAELHRDGADPEADAQARRDVAAAQLAKIAAMLG